MNRFKIGELQHVLKRFIHPDNVAGFFFKRQDTRINKLKNFLQVLILRFFFLTDHLERCIDLIKTLSKRLYLNGCMFHIKAS